MNQGGACISALASSCVRHLRAEALSFRGPPRVLWQVQKAVGVCETPLNDEEHLLVPNFSPFKPRTYEYAACQARCVGQYDPIAPTMYGSTAVRDMLNLV